MSMGVVYHDIYERLYSREFGAALVNKYHDTPRPLLFFQLID